MAAGLSTSERTRWLAWHLHLGSPAQSVSDRVISEVVAPTVADLGDRPWFFIRYWQAGPHVRLRIGDLEPDEVDATEALLARRLAVAGRLAADEQPVAEAGYRVGAGRFALSERGADREVADLLAPGVYRRVYEPEYERYGGVGLMARTERLFRLSSEIVLAVLPRLSSVGTRMVLALRGTVAAAAALGDLDVRAEFYTRGRQAWRGWAAEYGLPPEQIEQLCRVAPTAGAALDPGQHGPFAAWHHAVAELVAELLATTAVPPGLVVSSHVHMLHNRLGLSLFDELRDYAVLAARFPERVAG